ncbi:aspartyl protease family protein [Sphingomonas sp. TX0543]|uniref:aspartyl protease family protein n=1 Tax=unclassified Sphingomonas TaxID=196159 RepID=UPI0010F7FA76|nr:aspartyl protease family protein [Sphingomonas sp. 3P27F8]
MAIASILSLILAAGTPAALAPLPAMPPGARAAGVSRLSPDAEGRWVSFDLTPGNQIRFDMTVDGKPLTAILDTGVSYSVLARRYAESAKLPISAGGSATAIGGAVDIGWVVTRDLVLGGLTRTGGGLSVADLPAIATGSARPVDLLVGRDLTGDYAIDIDYGARRFRLLRSGRLPFRGAVAPLAISRDKRVYIGEVTLGGARLRPMVVDTGDGSSITVTSGGWREARLPGVRTTTAISFGLAGSVVSTIGIVPQLAVGQLVARNVEVRAEPVGGFSEAIGAAGRIGSGFLQNYRVLLDPAAGRMVLSPEAGADEPPLRSTSGLLLGIEPERLRVLHVMRGGPAAAAGWREGDLICMIDGQPIARDYAESPLATWSAGRAGRIVSLGMCDGSARKLTLSDFY